MQNSMSKETDKSRRQVLKALGMVGLAASAGEAFGLTLFSATAQGQTSLQHPLVMMPIQRGGPTPVSAKDPMVMRAVRAAQSAQLGKRRVALRLESSSAHKIVHEFKLPPDLAKKSGREAMAIEAVALAISDANATKALRDRLSQLKMGEARKPQAFYFIRARRADKKGGSREFNFVLGLVESAKEVAATVMRIDLTTKIPGWTLVQSFTKPVQGVMKVDSSLKDGSGEEAEEDKDYGQCYIDVLTVLLPIVSPFLLPLCGACVTTIIALPATAGVAAIVSIPSCIACAAAIGVALAVPAAVCFGEI